MPWNYSILDFLKITGVFLGNNNTCGSISRLLFLFMFNLKMKNFKF